MAAREVIHFPFWVQLSTRQVFPAYVFPQPVAKSPPEVKSQEPNQDSHPDRMQRQRPRQSKTKTETETETKTKMKPRILVGCSERYIVKYLSRRDEARIE